MQLLRVLRNFVANKNETHSIMKIFYIKTMNLCILLFMFTPVAWTQDIEETEQSEQTEQTEQAEQTEQTEQAEQIEQIEQIETDSLQIYIQNAQYRQAIEYIDLLEPTKDLLFQKALCCKSLNEYSSAIEILTALSDEYPDEVPIKLQLALCYEAVSQYSKSIDCFDHLLQLDSTNSYFEVRKADLLYRSEKYALAIDAYTHIDSTYNQNYITRCIAMCYEKLNQNELAKEYYKLAWELNANDAYSANSLVKIFVKEEDFNSAHYFSEKFIENDSTNLTMNALNAYVYYNLQQYDIALERFEKCLQQGDSSLIVNRSIGIIYYLADMDSLALVFLQRAFLQDTTNDNVLYILGKVNYNLDFYPEAIECFQKLIEKTLEQTPKPILFYRFYYDLAMSYEKNESFSDAANFYSRAASYNNSLDNNSKMALYYKIATLFDEKLMNYINAIYYYRQYRVTLLNYQNSFKEEEQEINEIEAKLIALDKYIEELTEKAKVK